MKIKHLPIHPQWLVFRKNHAEFKKLALQLRGKRVLDIGCGEQQVRPYLSEDTEYFGLDYYETAVNLYGTRPQIFADAQTLPFANASMDTVLLLDVLEHLPRPEKCLAEIARILRPGGCCTVQVPFIYPIHDAPLDFQRWTRYGLYDIAQRHGLAVVKSSQTGKPIETAALLTNIALCKTLFNWIDRKNPLLLLGIFLPPLIPVINILAYLLGIFSPDDDMMPYRYRLLLKQEQ